MTDCDHDNDSACYCGMFNDGSKDAKTLKMMWTVVKNTGGSGHGYRKSREQHIPHVCYGHGKRVLAVPKIEKTNCGGLAKINECFGNSDIL